MSRKMSAAIEAIYEVQEGSMSVEEYHAKHHTPSLLILTVLSLTDASVIVERFRDRIANKSVVEIGAGVGYLSLELAKYASEVFAIESDPAWSWLFTQHLYKVKPPHLTWIFGRAEAVASWLHADVAVIVTRSGHEEMQAVARRMAPTVIDIYGEATS